MKPMPTRSTLAELCESAGPWVTILTPLNGGGPLAKGDPARYRNLVKAAAEQLAIRANGEGHAIVERLSEIANDRSVFNAGAPGMVVYASPNGVHMWHLPETVKECAVVDDRPHLEPLLPIVSKHSHFYVVALTLHGTRLFSCDRFEARPLPLPDAAPSRLEDAAGYEIEQDSLQLRTFPKRRGTYPMFHGQGGGDDDREVDIQKYVRAVDQALAKAIPHLEAPVVLACDPHVEGIFRQITHLPNLVRPAIHGNYERATADAIHQHAWALMAPVMEERTQAACKRYQALDGTGRTAERIEEVVPLASQGQIETLFVREGATLEGHFDEQDWKVQLDGQAEEPKSDLIDRAASDTYLNRGTVHVLRAEEMPSNAPLAAILRW